MSDRILLNATHVVKNDDKRNSFKKKFRGPFFSRIFQIFCFCFFLKSNATRKKIFFPAHTKNYNVAVNGFRCLWLSRTLRRKALVVMSPPLALFDNRSGLGGL